MGAMGSNGGAEVGRRNLELLIVGCTGYWRCSAGAVGEWRSLFPFFSFWPFDLSWYMCGAGVLVYLYLYHLLTKLILAWSN
jgi:hypothetical protein